MTARILAIGIDGADWSQMSERFKHGFCPNLSRLYESGRLRQLEKPTGLSDDAVWSSFGTGVTIGEHGRYHGPHQYYPGTYRPINFVERPVETRPFWEALDEQGYKCAVLDVPKCPLAKPMRYGFQVSDWLVHGRDFPEPVSSPTAYASETVSTFGAAPSSPCATYTLRRGQPFHPGFSDEEARSGSTSKVENPKGAWNRGQSSKNTAITFQMCFTLCGTAQLAFRSFPKWSGCSNTTPGRVPKTFLTY